MNNIEELKNLILKSKKTMVLTGAGISTDSGIPDFRSKDTGLWEQMDPMEALSTRVLYKNPEKFYGEGFKILTDINEGVEPNKSHKALVTLEEKGLIFGVATQNIDNLHHKAGSKTIYEMHGNTREGYCIECGQVVDLQTLEHKINAGQLPPKCDICSGNLRPSVTLFGDMLPEDFSLAQEEIMTSDLLIVIGSSLMVSPVNILPRLAGKYVIINKTPTIMDEGAALVINENSTEVLTELLKKLD